MVLQMLEEHLRGLLPESTLDSLASHFRAAKARISSVTGRGRHQWLDKVRVVPANQRLIPPVVNRVAQAELLEALLGGFAAELRYRPRDATKSVTYEVNPLAIVQRGPITYLVATIFQYPDVRLLALHRIQSATRLDRSAVRPEDFDLDRYVHEGRLDFGNGEQIRLRIRFFDGAGDHLYETPLHRNQRIVQLSEGITEITAKVPHTPQLEWWIQAFLDRAEVVEPKALRATLLRRIKRLATRYR